MMNSKLSIVLKVFILSAASAVAIKYLAPYLEIPATPTNALVTVFLPAVVMILALAWRSTKTPSGSVENSGRPEH